VTHTPALSGLIRELKRLVAARGTLIQLVTFEEERAERVVAELAAALFPRPVPIGRWTCTEGLTGPAGSVPDTRDPVIALDHVIASAEIAFWCFEDLGPHLAGNPRLVRRLRDAARALSASYTTLFLISPTSVLPPDLHRDVTTLDLPLPDAAELEENFGRVLEDSAKTAALAPSLSAPLRAILGRAGLGLTHRQAVEAYRKVLAGKPVLDEGLARAITEEKRQLVRRAAALDFVEDAPRLDEVGGLEVLKAWLAKRKDALAAAGQGLALPKGLLLTGVSGCGKSLACKAVASHWGLPLLRFNMASLYAGDGGASPEEALATTIRIAETASPCVLWIDEIEAGVSINTQKAGQGSASRVLAALLNWMQEKRAFVFVAATANVIDLLPPEVLRKGRFDEIFYVGLPRHDERLEIFRIHLQRAGEDAARFDLEALAKSTNGYNGAEIEQVVTSARVECLHAGRALSQEDLVVTAASLVPLSVTMREEIGRMERWAHSRAVMASGPRRND
jgi:hypothetical protein